MEDLIALLKFAIVNEDKFTEYDPDFVKRGWIENAKAAVELAETEAFDKAFEHPAHEPDDDAPYVGEDAERADTAYDQWLHNMGQGA